MGGPFAHRPVQEDSGWRCRVCNLRGEALPLPGGCPACTSIEAIHDMRTKPLTDARTFERAARELIGRRVPPEGEETP